MRIYTLARASTYNLFKIYLINIAANFCCGERTISINLCGKCNMPFKSFRIKLLNATQALGASVHI